MTATALIPAVIGIDPGKNSGIGVVTIEAEPRLIWHDDVLCPSGSHRNEQNAIIIADSKAHGECCSIAAVVLEDQYMGKNVRQTIRLCQRAGRWEGAADNVYYSNVSIKYLLPRAWQSILKKDRRGTKAASKQFVKDKYGICVSEHKADAIGMAYYWARKIQG